MANRYYELLPGTTVNQELIARMDKDSENCLYVNKYSRLIVVVKGEPLKDKTGLLDVTAEFAEE